VSHEESQVGQATVHAFDEASGAGSVITDDGRVFHFSGDVFAASPLLTLRVGQRLRVRVHGSPATVTTLTLVTFPDPA
jgi:2-phospho-L-lactate guanylyltransferase